MVEKKTIAIAAVLVMVFLAIALAPQLFKPSPPEDIENEEYVDPGVLEGSKLPENVPFSEAQNFSGENCESNKNPDDKDYCYLVQADSTGSIESCEKIYAIDSKNACVRMLAVDKANTSYCNYSVSAYAPNDNSNVKYACITAVAKDQAEEKICEEIQNAGWKKTCVETVQKELGIY